MKLFSLTVDFAFKALFAPNPDLLMSLPGMMGTYRNGLQECTKKGIEGFYLGIQLNLEVRFNAKDNLLM